MPQSKTKENKDAFEKILSAYEQAMKAFHKRDFEKAEGLLSACLETDPSKKEVVDRARVYLSICRNAKENKTLPLKTFDDYYQAGVYFVNRGEIEEAVKLLSKARKMEPEQGKIPYMMSIAALKQENVDEAFAHLEKAVELDDFFAILAKNEIDFGDIRDDDRFDAIVKND